MSVYRQAWYVRLLLLTSVLSGGCGWLFGPWDSEPESGFEEAEMERQPATDSRAATDSPRAPDSRAAGVPVALRDAPDVLDRVIAVVNNDVVTLSELQEAVAFFVYESKKTVKPEDMGALKEQLLTHLIERRLQLQEAIREQIVVGDDEVDKQLAGMMKRANVGTEEELQKAIEAQGLTLAALKNRLRRQLMVQRVVQRKVRFRVSVTEGEIEKYFLENRDKLETGLSYRARHILLTPKPPADEAAWEAARAQSGEVWAKIRAGEDFAELAKQYSHDPTAQDGGDLGVLKQGEITPALEHQILRLRSGEAAAPFRSELGFHVFKLEWKESLSGEALRQAKRQIRDILFRRKYAARLKAWLTDIRARGIVDIRM